MRPIWMAIIILILATAVHGATLATSTVFTVNGDNYICMATNLSGSPVSVTAQVIDSSTGTLLATNTATIGTNLDMYAFVVSAGSERYFCKFKTEKASTIRAAATLYSAGKAYIVIPAK